MRRGLLALAALAALPAAAQTGPTAEMVTLRSQALGQDRAINIYVPPGYAAGDARYPVLYMVDGGVRQGFAQMTVLVDTAIARGMIRDLVVVGVEAGNRERELTFPGGDGDAPGRSAALRRFIGSEVKPWVEAHYRTSGQDALAGCSLGGLFVVETLLRAPDLFDDYIAASPSLWWNNGALLDDSADLLERLPAGNRRLWLALGNEGAPMGVGRLMTVLKRHAPTTLSWSFKSFPTEPHLKVCEKAPAAAILALYPRES